MAAGFIVASDVDREITGIVKQQLAKLADELLRSFHGSSSSVQSLKVKTENRTTLLSVTF